MGGKPQVSAQILFPNSVALNKSCEHSVLSSGNADLTVPPLPSSSQGVVNISPKQMYRTQNLDQK